ATAHFSGGAGGASGMHQWIMATFGLDADSAWNAMVFLRKGMHFFGYGLLAQSARTLASRLALPWPVVLGLLWCFAHASLDEARQAGTLGRTGTAWDVLLNLSGAAFVMAVAELASMGRRPGQRS
ncbi:MAG: VanZ family protein, partial [Nitrospirae bacterium]|nr:VanZ family protein [Fimbriimonadaceae bacterium]